MIIGGGLPLDGTHRANRKRDSFLFPVKLIGRAFRGKMLARLISFLDACEMRGVNAPQAFAALKGRLYRKVWVVYAKRPLAGAEQLFRFLGRYTHPVGLSDYRLLDVTDAAVMWKTRGDSTATVEPVEFIRRLLQHVLPKGFVKIRHAGLCAAGNVNTRLVRSCELLTDEFALDDDGTIGLDAIIAELSTMPVAGCPSCGGRIACHPMPASGGGSTRAPPRGRTP